jgi:uncharacterized membrane protein
MISIRILYMPPVYAVISFFSFRYFRAYTYYELVEVGESPFHAIFRWIFILISEWVMQ